MSGLSLTAASVKLGIAEKDLARHANGGSIKAKTSTVPACCVVRDEAIVCGTPVIDNTHDTYVEVKDQAIIKGGTIGKYASIGGTAIVLDGAVVPDYAFLTSGTLIGKLPCEKVGEWYMGLCGPGVVYIGCMVGDQKWWDDNIERLADEFKVRDQIEVYRKKVADLFALKSPFEVLK